MRRLYVVLDPTKAEMDSSILKLSFNISNHVDRKNAYNHF